jgi:hypothetical protein
MNALEVGAGPFWVRFGHADHAARAAGLPSIADSNGARDSFGVGDHFRR